MMRIASPLVCLLAVAGISCHSRPAPAEEVLRWERLPLAVPLIVGQERVLIVDRPMRVGLPADLRERLRVQSAGGALYLRASAPFAPTRVQLEDRDSGELILLDVQAKAPVAGRPALEPIHIVNGLARGATRSSAAVNPKEESPPAEAPDSNTPVPVVLTRYAAQSLYAPLRTVEPVTGITRASLPPRLDLDSVLPTQPVQLQPLAAWHLQDEWVTALKLTNRSSSWLALDPRALQGDYVAATFQHHSLGPHGDPTDTTVLYLVTQSHGLAGAVLPHLSPIDSSSHVPSAAARP